MGCNLTSILKRVTHQILSLASQLPSSHAMTFLFSLWSLPDILSLWVTLGCDIITHRLTGPRGRLWHRVKPVCLAFSQVSRPIRGAFMELVQDVQFHLDSKTHFHVSEFLCALHTAISKSPCLPSVITLQPFFSLCPFCTFFSVRVQIVLDLAC